MPQISTSGIRKPGRGTASAARCPLVWRGVTRLLIVAGLAVAALVSIVLPVQVSAWWLFLTAPLLVLAAVAVRDVSQSRHALLRNYPVIGHARYLMETVRPEIQQYFIERNTDGTPFDRNVRDLVYQRAKGTKDVEPFGTERNVYAAGYDSFTHSMVPVDHAETEPRVRIGGPDCVQPYDMSLLNVSAMSFGSLSAQAVLALNGGAAKGGFAHVTGEGAVSDYHLRPGGDLVWQIGTGYFGCRTHDGRFDPEKFASKAANPAVKCIELKLSQGAKPGHGGVLPGSKVTGEIARVRDVPEGKTVFSPGYHQEFSTPRELIQFLARLRELSGGKPVGFKLCVGSRREVLAVCKAMVEERTTPDFVVVDGSEGGTGAAPVEFADFVGTTLTDGLMIMHNALTGVGVRDQVKIGVSGKVATGADIVKRLVLGADYTNSARAMMFAVGCIQAQACHTNTCPVGVATQDPGRARALDVADKTERVYRFHKATVSSALELMASMGARGPEDLHTDMLRRRVDANTVRPYSELYEWLAPGELLEHAPASWQADWSKADADSFTA